MAPAPSNVRVLLPKESAPVERVNVPAVDVIVEFEPSVIAP